MPSTRDPAIAIEPMTAADWPEVRRIYAEGIATGDATLEREAPDWGHFDRSHPPDCRLVARSVADGVVGWTALGGYSARRSTAASRGRASTWGSARGHGVGRRLLEALIEASEAAGYWTLLAGVLAENERSLALHERVGFRESVSSAGSARTPRTLAGRRPSRTAQRDHRPRLNQSSATGRRPASPTT